jgi:monovalent cation:proton antiporter-2 (CPA2) family protein
MLQTLVALLAATAIAVPVSRRLGFGSILGYLVAGAVIGPSGLRLVTDVGHIAEISELGVVMLLFLIGLELRPHRLWVLRRAILGLGFGQMLPSALLLAGIARLAGVDWDAAAVLGAGLALSSTAIVLPMLAERELLPSTAGRDSFAVLLFQDVAFIPMVAAVPLLAGAPLASHVPWLDVLRALAVVAAILVGGSVLVRPLFRLVGGANTPEVFTATALLLVVGTAALADWAGLSMSLGAFMAGVMLSDSDYRHELQADIAPFQGLLLGFFFISVGMSTDLGLALRAPASVAAAVLVLIAAKSGVAFAVGIAKRRSVAHAVRFSLALAEGSECSFVLFTAAIGVGVLSREVASLATLAVALSMAAAPILFSASETLLTRRTSRRRAPVYDPIQGPPAPVIICGFGRVGQIVGRVLRMQRIPFTALDKDPEQIDVVRRYGGRVYFGDPTRLEVLRAAGAEGARVLVVALPDMEATLHVATMAKRHFPHLAILARARNRQHAYRLMDLGIAGIVRETFYSSLRLSELVMAQLGVPRATAERAIELFRVHDERTLEEMQAVAGDEQLLIQSTREAARELTELFESDRATDQPERESRIGSG